VIAAVFVLALAAFGTATSEADKKKDQPLRLGLVEKAGVELTLLDVEVTDEKGQPVRGLTKSDFAATLNWKPWPIYSVDDLCDRGESPAAAIVANDVPAPNPRSVRRPPEAPSRFILYFDFSQLEPDGRGRAVEESRRWIHESLRPSDEVSIVTYGTDPGVTERCPFTADRRKLADAIDAIENDPKQIEAWPGLLPKRMCECGMFSGACGHTLGTADDWVEMRHRMLICAQYAADEYSHGQRSLEALRAFLDSLGETPGRKAVLYFNQNGVFRPGSLYDQPIDKGGDFTGLLDDAASAATASRASVYPVFTGNELDPDAANLTPGAVNFGANLADATGGRSNRGLGDLRRLLDATARGGACVYRIGLRPPPGTPRAVYRVRVAVRGKSVPWLYRIRFEDEMDRWLKSARAVLRNPSGVRDLPVGAALVPVSCADGRWKLSVQVSLDADGMAYLPVTEGREAQWQVGALLHREGKAEAWEMLGVTRIHRKGEAQPAAVVHRTEIDDLHAGRYRLSAFVRDENTSLFGGAEAVIDLPLPDSDGIAGPVVMRSPRKFFMAALPALAGTATKITSVSEIREEALPARAAPLETGDTLVVETWLCSRAGAGSGSSPVRFLSSNGVPLFRFEPAGPRPAGRCLMYADAIDAKRLPAGAYSYRFRWNSPGRVEPHEAEAAFEIAPATSALEVTLPAPN
jgi:VWFA-related protein